MISRTLYARRHCPAAWPSRSATGTRPTATPCSSPASAGARRASWCRWRSCWSGLGVAAALLGRSIARPLLPGSRRTAQALGRGELGARTGISRRDELGEVARAFDEMAAPDGGAAPHADGAHRQCGPRAAHAAGPHPRGARPRRGRRRRGGPSSLAEITEDLGELERLVDDVLASARMELAAGAPPAGRPAHPSRPRWTWPASCRGSVDRLTHSASRLAPSTCTWRSRSRRWTATPFSCVGPSTTCSTTPASTPRPLPPSPCALPGSRRGSRYEVEDQGDGIAPEDLERLFTPFFRADPSRARRPGGSGSASRSRAASSRRTAGRWWPAAPSPPARP